VLDGAAAKAVRSTPVERMSKTQANAAVVGNRAPSRSTTKLSVHSGKWSPCMTGS